MRLIFPSKTLEAVIAAENFGISILYFAWNFVRFEIAQLLWPGYCSFSDWGDRNLLGLGVLKMWVNQVDIVKVDTSC